MDNSLLISSSSESANNLSTRSSFANSSFQGSYDPYKALNSNIGFTTSPTTASNTGVSSTASPSFYNFNSSNQLNWSGNGNKNSVPDSSTKPSAFLKNSPTTATSVTNSTNSNTFNMDIWNSASALTTDSALHLNLSSNPNSNSNSNPTSNSASNLAKNYDPVYSLNTDTSGLYKSNFSNVEMDPLAYQMLQLSTKDSISQLTTPSLIQNTYFGNSNVNYNRQLKENKNQLFSSNNNNNNGNNNNGNTNNENSNTINPTLNDTNWSNNNSDNSNNTYNNYLLQQKHQNSFSNQYTYKPPKQQMQSNNLLHSQSQSMGMNMNYDQTKQNQHYIHSHNHFNSDSNNNSNNNNGNNINNIPNNASMDNKAYNIYDSRVLKMNQSKSSDIDPSEIENYKTKIQLKDIIISKLELELEKLKDFQNTILKTQNESNNSFEIPKNHEELYHKLVEKVRSTEAELEDTKTRLESLITAISMNSNSSSFKSGRYDEEEISHKIISKLKMLTEENDELSRMVSYGKSKEKDIEIALLRKQNNDLLEKVSKLEAKLNDKK